MNIEKLRALLAADYGTSQVNEDGSIQIDKEFLGALIEAYSALPALLDRLEKLEETFTTGKQLTRERVMQVMEAFCREKDAQDMCDLLFGVEE